MVTGRTVSRQSNVELCSDLAGSLAWKRVCMHEAMAKGSVRPCLAHMFPAIETCCTKSACCPETCNIGIACAVASVLQNALSLSSGDCACKPEAAATITSFSHDAATHRCRLCHVCHPTLHDSDPHPLLQPDVHRRFNACWLSCRLMACECCWQARYAKMMQSNDIPVWEQQMLRASQFELKLAAESAVLEA